MRATASSASVRADTILGVARSLTHPLYQRFQGLEPAFRTAIPALVGIFLVILGASAFLQTSAMRDDALVDAAGDMDLVSALVARELDNATLAGKEPATVLAALTARHLAAHGRIVHVSGADGRVDEGVVAHGGCLDDRARPEDDEENPDEHGDGGPKCGLEAFEPLIQRMRQRSRYAQNRIGAHGCAIRVGTRHARPPSEIDYRQ